MVIYPWKKGWKNNWTFDPGLSRQRLSDEIILPVEIKIVTIGRLVGTMLRALELSFKVG